MKLRCTKARIQLLCLSKYLRPDLYHDASRTSQISPLRHSLVTELSFYKENELILVPRLLSVRALPKKHAERARLPHSSLRGKLRRTPNLKTVPGLNIY